MRRARIGFTQQLRFDETLSHASTSSICKLYEYARDVCVCVGVWGKVYNSTTCTT